MSLPDQFRKFFLQISYGLLHVKAQRTPFTLDLSRESWLCERTVAESGHGIDPKVEVALSTPSGFLEDMEDLKPPDHVAHGEPDPVLGKVKLKTAPSSSELRAVTWPPGLKTNPRTRASPTPVPVNSFSVWRRWRILNTLVHQLFAMLSGDGLLLETGSFEFANKAGFYLE